MVEAGLTPKQALVAATSGSARCMGLALVGRLEAGAWADFLVLRADPARGHPQHAQPRVRLDRGQPRARAGRAPLTLRALSGPASLVSVQMSAFKLVRTKTSQRPSGETTG